MWTIDTYTVHTCLHKHSVKQYGTPLTCVISKSHLHLKQCMIFIREINNTGNIQTLKSSVAPTLVFYGCNNVFSLLSASLHLFSAHASHCQSSDRLIHVVITAPKKIPIRPFSPLFFFCPLLLFTASLLNINHQVCVHNSRHRGETRRSWNYSSATHWMTDILTDSLFCIFTLDATLYRR